jgi:hypothetical protein
VRSHHGAWPVWGRGVVLWLSSEHWNRTDWPAGQHDRPALFSSPGPCGAGAGARPPNTFAKIHYYYQLLSQHSTAQYQLLSQHSTAQRSAEQLRDGGRPHRAVRRSPGGFASRPRRPSCRASATGRWSRWVGGPHPARSHMACDCAAGLCAVTHGRPAGRAALPPAPTGRGLVVATPTPPRPLPRGRGWL